MTIYRTDLSVQAHRELIQGTLSIMGVSDEGIRRHAIEITEMAHAFFNALIEITDPLKVNEWGQNVVDSIYENYWDHKVNLAAEIKGKSIP